MSTESKKQEMIIDWQKRMDQDEMLNCMRCGFCLPSCPTYEESGFQESQSPRGRIALMKGVADGIIEPDEKVEESLNQCLGCRACEPVCPSGVKYGHLLEEVRDVVNQNKTHSLPEKVIRRGVFYELFPHQNRMRMAVGFLGLYQRTGLQKIVRKTKLLNRLPEPMGTMEKVLPQVPKMRDMKNRPMHYHMENPRKRVAFFSGCLMDTMFMSTNDATATLLQKAGCDIVIPESQACCGALHGHSGEKEKAKAMAKRNIEAFEELNVDYIVTNAGGCGAFLIDYGHLLKEEPEWAERAEAFAGKLKDMSTVLMELDFPGQGYRLPEQVITYQDSCHLKNVMHTTTEPRQLLQSIQGTEYKEMKDAGRCCGSAGIYNIVESEMSMKILDSKMINAKATAAATIVTTNPGCLLQMKLGIEREGLTGQVRAVHLADLLLEAVEYEEKETSSV